MVIVQNFRSAEKRPRVFAPALLGDISGCICSMSAVQSGARGQASGALWRQLKGIKDHVNGTRFLLKESYNLGSNVNVFARSVPSPPVKRSCWIHFLCLLQAQEEFFCSTVWNIYINIRNSISIHASYFEDLVLFMNGSCEFVKFIKIYMVMAAANATIPEFEKSRDPLGLS